jgi:lipoprotein-anchoring transpeptidase ErfK/SrfK
LQQQVNPRLCRIAADRREEQEGRSMLRLAALLFALAWMNEAAFAQWGWGWESNPWEERRWEERRRSPSYQPPLRDDFLPWEWGNPDRPRRPPAPAFRSGGARPAIAPVEPAKIAFPSDFPVGSIVIDQKGRQLILVQSATEALHYPISVGREGFTWTGSEPISKVVEWPDWYPPEEMRARDPSLPEHMSGGLKNPLGAKALYLGKTLYRVHGTNDARSIGRAASSGCFRMLNGHVVDLASRVEIGTVVTVVKRLPPELERIVVDQVRPEGDRIGARERRPS